MTEEMLYQTQPYADDVAYDESFADEEGGDIEKDLAQLKVRATKRLQYANHACALKYDDEQSADHRERSDGCHQDQYDPDIGVEKVEPAEDLWIQLFDGLHVKGCSSSVMQAVDCKDEVIVAVFELCKISDVDFQSACHVAFPAVDTLQHLKAAHNHHLVILVEVRRIDA